MGFKSGEDWNGNRKGRGPGKWKKDFDAAISAVSKTEKKSLLRHLIERAYMDDQVLIAVAKKILPDKIEDVSNKEKLILIRPSTKEDKKAKK